MRLPEKRGSRAILLGTALYENFKPIPAIDNNLSKLKEILTTSGSGGFLEENCHCISNPQDPKELVEHISAIAAEATDVLLFYSTGHGVLDLQTRKLHLALQHTVQSDLYYTAVPFALIKDAIKRSPAQIKVLILDCCYSGKAIAEMAMSNLVPLVQEQIEVQGVYTLTSSPGIDISLAIPGDEFTVFSGSLFEVWGSRTASDGRALTMGEVYRKVCSSFPEGYPRPQQLELANAADLALVGCLPKFNSVTRQRVTIAVPRIPYIGYPLNVGGPGTAIEGSVATPLGGTAVVRLQRNTDPTRLPPTDINIKDQEEGLRALQDEANQADQNGDIQFPEATIAILRKNVTDMIRLAYPEHPMVLEGRALLAYWLAVAGQYGDAARIYKRTITVREAEHGREDSMVLSSRHNLAHVTGLAGDEGDAAAQFSRLVDDRARLLGAGHRDTLESLEGHAHWSGVSGDDAKAVELYGSLVDEYEWELGDTDEKTLHMLDKRAYWRAVSGDHAGASKDYSDLAARWTQAKDPDHPEVTRCTKSSDYWAPRGHHDE